MKWTIVGEVTDLSYNNPNTSLNDTGMMPELFKNLAALTTSFSTLTGTRNAIRMAPIAIYVEHSLSENDPSDD